MWIPKTEDELKFDEKKREKNARFSGLFFFFFIPVITTLQNKFNRLCQICSSLVVSAEFYLILHLENSTNLQRKYVLSAENLNGLRKMRIVTAEVNLDY